jgi:multidrug efflux pump subunit AcrA (membrane-fusion protein)
MSFSKSLSLSTLIAAALLTSACGSSAPERKAESSGAAITVRTTEAKTQPVPEVYEATGTVRAHVSSVLSARVMGYIREIKVQAGDTVQAGQEVASIDAREIDTALRQAEAARTEAQGALPEVDNAIAAAEAKLDLATATFNRMKTLFSEKSITNQEFDEAQARFKMARANVEMARSKKAQLQAKIRQADEAVAQARIQQGYMRVAAPFTGLVVERKAEPGMLAAPGMPILLIEQAGAYRLEAAVEESRLASIKAGTPVTVRLDAASQDIEGRVAEIVPALDTMSRTFTARINLPASPLVRSGLFGRALFPVGEKSALTVPASAIVRQGQVERAFVALNGVARARLVKTGSSRDGAVEILSGLSEGEHVIAPVPAALVDGARIEVRP